MSKTSKSRPQPQPQGKPESKAPAKVRSAAPSRADEAGKADKTDKADRADPAERWAEVASFVVTFERRAGADGAQPQQRITAHKMQDGGISERWSGRAQQPMVAWMIDQVGEWEADAPPAGLPQAATSYDAWTVSIQDFRAITQHARSAFDLEAQIELQDSGTGADDGQAASSVAPLPPCTVSFYSRNVGTRDKAALGTVVLEEPDATTGRYHARLADLRLPAGEYRLETVALLRGRNPKVAHRAGLVLHMR